MDLPDDRSTSPTLLEKVADWYDHEAWVRFRDQYDPRMRRWCRVHGLDDDSVDEVCHRIWIELADRMKTFEYDPSRSFGGWLRRLCESRIIDFLRQRRVDRLLSLDGLDGDPTAEMAGAAAGFGGNHEDEGEVGPVRLALLETAERVQALVRARIKPHTWDAFWLVVVYDWTVARTAASLGMSHTAVYNARVRVARMLCDEGERSLNGDAAGS